VFTQLATIQEIKNAPVPKHTNSKKFANFSTIPPPFFIEAMILFFYPIFNENKSRFANQNTAFIEAKA
jgi:hypothetical protein